MTIEESFEQLDNIIASLENKDTSLEEAFRQYEKGIAIVKDCNAALDKVEKQVKVLQGGDDDSEEA
ncbi:MAG: exodeoxyribonuclease VII small subunit [Butyrivibrio sp.]